MFTGRGTNVTDAWVETSTGLRGIRSKHMFLHCWSAVMYLCRHCDHSWKRRVSLQACEGHLFCAERATAVHERSSSLSALHTSVTQLPPDIYLTIMSCEHHVHAGSSFLLFSTNVNVLIFKQCVRLPRLMPKVSVAARLAYLFCQLKTSSDAGMQTHAGT